MKTAAITCRVSEIEKAKLEALAAKKDIPISQIVREAIKKYVEEQ